MEEWEDGEQQVIKKSLSFDDILLTPQYSDIESRSEVDIGIDLGRGIYLDVPIISSPMDTVTETEMVVALRKLGGLGILHRYNTPQQQAKIVWWARGDIHREAQCIGAAVGITGDFYERATELVAAGATLLCIDVAHGHHSMMKRALSALRKGLGDSIHIMASNVATLEGFNALADWGADSIRVGIGGGSICSTRIQTGHGVPTLQSVLDCGKSDRDARLIADGGIKNSGDIVKALAAGADAVMIGSVLSGTKETPGPILEDNAGQEYKAYRGMASRVAQMDWRGHSSSPEGISTTVPYKGPAQNILNDLAGGIRSGLSYSGVRSISELQARSTIIQQTNAGQFESSTHILKG